MSLLVLLRHGQSQWNLENRFTGWKDVNLSEKGILEARESGKSISEKKISIDKVYSSSLKRAKDTAFIAMKEAKYEHLFSNDQLIMTTHIALNERNYGDLTGLNKKETSEKFGSEQVHIWRRSFEIHPPGGESLKNVFERVKPYFENKIKKNLDRDENILISAHGNSLRALFIVLNISTIKNISSVEIPTGKPYIVEFKNQKIVSSYYI